MGAGMGAGAMDYSLSAEKSMMPVANDSYDASVTDRQIIKTANLSLHVEDVRAAATEVEGVTTQEGGNVISSSVTRGDKSYYGYMTVKVPADKFDETMTALTALAVYVESQDTNASDVTEQYMDLQSRLTNKQAEEAQYLAILKQADNVTDTLAVTQALSNVRYEIESLQGQIKLYDSQIDYSTINLSLSEDESAQAASETWNPGSTVHEAQSDFVVFLQGAVDLAIYAVIFGGPLLLILILVWLLRRGRKPGKR